MKAAIMPLIFLTVILNSIAQLLLKAGMKKVGELEFAWTNVTFLCSKIALNPYIFLGLCAYFFSFGAWLLVLSKADISYAYPLISLGYILSAITAYYFLGESLTILRVTGILIILCGVFLVSQS
jgi:drug/metabolite transporter (DMT)-like permease